MADSKQLEEQDGYDTIDEQPTTAPTTTCIYASILPDKDAARDNSNSVPPQTQPVIYSELVVTPPHMANYRESTA